MAYDVQEEINNDSGGVLDDEGRVTFKAMRSWNITNTDVGVSAQKVESDLQSLALIPRYGDSHPDNGFLVVDDVQTVRESQIYFKSKALYKSRPVDPANWENNDGSPVDIAAKVKWRSVRGKSEIDEDFDGNAIENPGTREPVSGVMRATTDWKAIITKIVPVFFPKAYQPYFENSNAESYLGFGPGEGLLIAAEADPVVFDGVEYQSLRAEIEFKTPYRASAPDKAWYHRRILRGFEQLNAAQYALGNALVEPVVDGEKNRVTKPVLLDAQGRRLDDPLRPLSEPTDPVAVETKRYGLIAYSGLGFF